MKKLIISILFLFTIEFIYSQSLPKIIVTSPTDQEKVTQPTCYLKGVVMDDVGVISIGFNEVSIGVEGKNVPFNYPIHLQKGKNEITIEAMNSTGDINRVTLTVFFEEEKVEIEKLKELKLEELKKKVEKVEEKPKEEELEIKKVVKKEKIRQKEKPEPKKVFTKIPKRIVRLPKIHKPVGKKEIGIKKERIGYPSIFIGNKKIHCKKEIPRIINKRVLCALEEEYINLLNIKVTEEKIGNKRIVTLTRGNKEVKLIVDNKVIIVNNVEKHIDVAPYLVSSSDDTVMIPFRAVFEELGFTVHWDKDNQRAIAFIAAASPP